MHEDGLVALLRAQATQKQVELVAEHLERPVGEAALKPRPQADVQDVAVHLSDRDLASGVEVHQALHLVKGTARGLKGTVKEGEGEELAARNVVCLRHAVELIGLGKLANVRRGKGGRERHRTGGHLMQRASSSIFSLSKID